MFEKKRRSTLQVIENLLDEYRYFNYKCPQNQQELRSAVNFNEFSNRSSNERNMTRKTRIRQPRIYSAIQSGYCAVCHSTYTCLEEHIQSKRHLKLIGEDTNAISLNGCLDDDSFFEFDIDEIEKTSFDYIPEVKRKMPRTRRHSNSERVKEPSMSPGSDSGHRLRSRKNINYMTPPLDEDSLPEKPEVVRELRSSTRLLSKISEQVNGNGEDVWSSGRPKRSCSNKHRYSADERLVVDNKSYYKVELFPSKLRSGQQQLNDNHLPPHQHQHYYKRRPETPPNTNDDKFVFKFRKMRNSELVQLNNEAENFLFPKKDDCSDEEEGGVIESVTKHEGDCKENEEDESSQSTTTTTTTTTDVKPRKRRRTHAEVFITDNEKYYKFETPGSRLRYQGSYLPSSVTSWVHRSQRNNGDYNTNTLPTMTTIAALNNTESGDQLKMKIRPQPSKKSPHINLSEYSFAFENVPQGEQWYQTFQRKDAGDEHYHNLGGYNYRDSLILPYQVGRIAALDPRECIRRYNQIKKCLTEPPSSTSTSASCSTPDPIVSNSGSSSVEGPSLQDEDSKMTEVSSTSSTQDQFKAVERKKPGPKPRTQSTLNKNPRKSPRQHASTLAILSSLLQQRKRKSRNPNKNNLPTIHEEAEKRVRVRAKKKLKVDHFAIARRIEEEMSRVVCESADAELECCSNGVQFNTSTAVDLMEILENCDENMLIIKAAPGTGTGTVEVASASASASTIASTSARVSVGKVSVSKAGRKPGKKKKNRTGWPNTNRRMKKPPIQKENNDSEIEDNSTDSINKQSESENNNKNDQSSIVDDNDDDNNCDDRVENEDKILTNKVNNNSSDNLNLDSLQLQPYVRVQKLDKTEMSVAKERRRRNTGPKRTNRSLRRMPASPRSPRMLRRPRGRWYRER